MMKIEPMICIWMFGYAMNFEPARNSKKKGSLGLFSPNLLEFGLFILYFVCKSNFRVISMIKIVILDQSKPIPLILKNPKFVNCTFIIHKNGN